MITDDSIEKITNTWQYSIICFVMYSWCLYMWWTFIYGLRFMLIILICLTLILQLRLNKHYRDRNKRIRK